MQCANAGAAARPQSSARTQQDAARELGLPRCVPIQEVGKTQREEHAPEGAAHCRGGNLGALLLW